MAGLVALLALSRQFVSPGGTVRATLQAVGAALLSMRDQAGLLGVVAFCVGGLLYFGAFHRSGLIPRWHSGAGLAAVVLLLAWLLALFGRTPMLSYVPLALPLAAQELVLAIWLIAKGFTAPAPRGAVQPQPPPIAPRPDLASALVQGGHP
jgi:hypothetical protein